MDKAPQPSKARPVLLRDDPNAGKHPQGAAPPSVESLTAEDFTSSTPWEDRQADCLVITCSDHRFREPTLDFVRHLGFKEPHILAVPSGVAIAYGLTAALGFLSKALTMLLSKAAELTGTSELICVAHEDCGGYKAGQVKLIGNLTRRLRGKSLREIQLIHLEKAARELQYALPNVNVRTFYADVVDGPGDGKRVNFTEIATKQRRVRR